MKTKQDVHVALTIQTIKAKYDTVGGNLTHLEWKVLDAEQGVKIAKESLIQQCQVVKDRAARAIATVEEGMTLNRLGELQGAGPEMDRLCSEYCQEKDRLLEFVMLWTKEQDRETQDLIKTNVDEVYGDQTELKLER